MTPFPYSVAANEDLGVARAMMESHDIHDLPVLRDGVLAGVLSARDVALGFDVFGAANTAIPLQVWTMCTREPYVVEIDVPLAEVADEMANRRIGCALVTKHGKLAGILTVTDVCRALAALLRELGPRDDGDSVA